MALIGSSGGANTLATLALGELVADKMPFTPTGRTGARYGAIYVGSPGGASIAKARRAELGNRGARWGRDGNGCGVCSV